MSDRAEARWRFLESGWAWSLNDEYLYPLWLDPLVPVGSDEPAEPLLSPVDRLKEIGAWLAAHLGKQSPGR